MPRQEQKEPLPPASVAKAIAEAQALTKAGKFADAIALLEARQKELGATITEDEKRALLVTVADAHFLWAKDAEKRYAWQEAIQHYQAAYDIDKTYRKRVAAIDLGSIGKIYDSLGKKAKALEFLNQAISLLRQVGNKQLEAATLYKIGLVYSTLGEPSKALESYNQALPISRQVGNKQGETATLTGIGAVYSYLGEPSKALEFYNKALPIRRQVGDKRGEAATLTGIGAVYSYLGEPSKALVPYCGSLLL